MKIFLYNCFIVWFVLSFHIVLTLESSINSHDWNNTFVRNTFSSVYLLRFWSQVSFCAVNHHSLGDLKNIYVFSDLQFIKALVMQYKSQCLKKKQRANRFLCFVNGLCQKYWDLDTTRILASFRCIWVAQCMLNGRWAHWGLSRNKKYLWADKTTSVCHCSFNERKHTVLLEFSDKKGRKTPQLSEMSRIVHWLIHSMM